MEDVYLLISGTTGNAQNSHRLEIQSQIRTTKNWTLWSLEGFPPKWKAISHHKIINFGMVTWTFIKTLYISKSLSGCGWSHNLAHFLFFPSPLLESKNPAKGEENRTLDQVAGGVESKMPMKSMLWSHPDGDFWRVTRSVRAMFFADSGAETTSSQTRDIESSYDEETQVQKGKCLTIAWTLYPWNYSIAFN